MMLSFVAKSFGLLSLCSVNHSVIAHQAELHHALHSEYSSFTWFAVFVGCMLCCVLLIAVFRYYK